MPQVVFVEDAASAVTPLDQFQAHKLKIIARTAGCRSARRPPGAGGSSRACTGGNGFRHPQPQWRSFTAGTNSTSTMKPRPDGRATRDLLWRDRSGRRAGRRPGRIPQRERSVSRAQRRVADQATPCYALTARVATVATSGFTTDAGKGVPTFSVSTSASINGPVMKATVRYRVPAGRSPGP
jgi:hypothetical protein